MKLITSDVRVSAICGIVEHRVGNALELAAVALPVELRCSFDDLSYPVKPSDPTAYDTKRQVILINGLAFCHRDADLNQFAIAHEIGHHVCDHLPSARTLRSSGVHSCVIADWYAARWGFSEELRKERCLDRGEEYCANLPLLTNQDDFLAWVEEWLIQYRTAKLLGRSLP